VLCPQSILGDEMHVVCEGMLLVETESAGC